MIMLQEPIWTLEHKPEVEQQRKPRRRSRRQRNPFMAKMSRHYRSISSQIRGIENMIQIFRDQVHLHDLECREAALRMIEMRGSMRAARTWLANMHPANSQRVQPGGLLRVLEALEDQIMEAILLVSVFETICDCPTLERIEMQLALSDSMLQLGIRLRDSISTFGAIIERAKEEGR